MEIMKYTRFLPIHSTYIVLISFDGMDKLSGSVRIIAPDLFSTDDKSARLLCISRAFSSAGRIIVTGFMWKVQTR